ncbi:hypothetical protein [Chitinophaga varians]|uniref:hypothetical protein n=1 Tax=Chitinophaga varians TaxID=2202339 RepID=UPI00165F937C|nr:hypothetical protein [Chitinophaga varians]MBC9914602.1 hypothetical protein [Chitinophaga varians]
MYRLLLIVVLFSMKVSAQMKWKPSSRESSIWIGDNTDSLFFRGDTVSLIKAPATTDNYMIRHDFVTLVFGKAGALDISATKVSTWSVTKRKGLYTWQFDPQRQLLTIFFNGGKWAVFRLVSEMPVRLESCYVNEPEITTTKITMKRVRLAQEPVIYSLFYHWNKKSLALAQDTPAIHQDRLAGFLESWKMNPDSFHHTSLRWRFLEQISAEFNWKDKRWSVIEMIRNGEIMRVDNYLVFYQGGIAHIMAYRYQTDKWVKIQEWQERFKTTGLVRKIGNNAGSQGHNNGDVVVTDFTAALPLRVAYFAEYTVPPGSEMERIISHSR